MRHDSPPDTAGRTPRALLHLLGRSSRGLLRVALCAAAGSALACSPVADRRPFAERLAAAPLAFIGTVTSATPDRIEFRVEHVVQGEPPQPSFSSKPRPSTCNLNFTVGQRWLYAGDTLVDPSLLLSGPGLAGRKPIQAQRRDDAALALPAAWQRCERDAQCRRIADACGPISAVRAEHQAAAEARLMRPTAGGCAAPVLATFAACVDQRCGLWTLVQP